MDRLISFLVTCLKCFFWVIIAPILLYYFLATATTETDVSIRIGVLMVVIGGFIARFLWRANKKQLKKTVCIDCGKARALKNIGQKVISENQTIEIIRKRGGSKGEKEKIYWNTIEYWDVVKCKFCDHIEKSRKIKKVKAGTETVW